MLMLNFFAVQDFRHLTGCANSVCFSNKQSLNLSMSFMTGKKYTVITFALSWTLHKYMENV